MPTEKRINFKCELNFLFELAEEVRSLKFLLIFFCRFGPSARVLINVIHFKLKLFDAVLRQTQFTSFIQKSTKITFSTAINLNLFNENYTQRPNTKWMNTFFSGSFVIFFRALAHAHTHFPSQGRKFNFKYKIRATIVIRLHYVHTFF